MKLLLAEDNPADARLVREMLADSRWGDFQIVQANRLETVLAHLRTDSFDEVLLDLGLPDCQGMATLVRTMEVAAALPIIVLTGLADERFAQQVVRAGAQDYLVKGSFDSEILVRTIRYAAERKGAEEKIRHLAAIVDCCKDAITSETLEGKILSWNDGAERIYGYSAAEMIGEPVARIILPTRAAEYAQVIERLRRGETVAQIETIRRRKDGTELNVMLTLSPIRDAAGRVAAISAIASDITDRKRTEAALLQSHAELRRFNQLTVGREMKIVELKQQVNALCAELSRPPRYPLQFLPADASLAAGSQPATPVPGAIPDPEQEHVHEST